jgi:dihydroorotate dehydrogenase
MYKILRPLLFLVDPEKIHHFVSAVLRLKPRFLKFLFTYSNPRLEKKFFGLTFRNPVGLAAGFDKDAMLVDEMEALGFGFVEIGTLTPLPQPGNERPRLFRLPKDRALINRMGFNNEGVKAAVSRLKKRSTRIIVGGNIGKNKMTANEKAHEDYLFCLDQLYDHVDYFVVNVSSPNTPGLRELQEKEPLQKLLQAIKKRSLQKNVRKPVLLKIAPDLSNTQLDDIVDILKSTDMDGVVATNTTVVRIGLQTNMDELARMGAGGVSGQPLRKTSTEVIRYLRSKLGKDFPIIGVGGIMSAADAIEKLKAGADLIQLYTGFIYEGPALIRRINREIVKTLP